MRKIVLLAVLGLVAACDQPKPRESAPPAPPAAAAATTPAPVPAWATSLQGQALATAFSTTIQCMGYVDGPQARTPQGVPVIGWSWMSEAKTGAPQVVLVDAAGKMVAFGAGGTARPDVPKNVPAITRPDVGWVVMSPGRPGVFTVYGVDLQTKTACRLGEARL